MTLYTPVGYALVTLLLLIVAGSPLFHAADRSWHAQSARTATIDGLRGFLALGVFFHHALIYNAFLTTGAWALPPSALFTELGQSSVVLFFMITGYLFWGKAIATKGRLPWVQLYIGRVFRIGPLYYLAIAAMLAVVFWRTGLALHQAWPELRHELVRLSLLGYFGPSNPINGYARPWIILAGVTWSLHFEWLFYLLLLPVSALFARVRAAQLPYVAVGLLVCLWRIGGHAPTVPAVGFGAFYMGMLGATLRDRGLAVAAGSWAERVASLALVGLLVAIARAPSVYALAPFLAVCAVFVLVSAGCTAFGLLTLTASRRLGEVSYGLYLLQGLVLDALLHVSSVRRFALASVPGYWVVLTAAALSLAVVALVGHLWVEKPGIRLGRALAQRVGAWRAQGVARSEPA